MQISPGSAEAAPADVLVVGAGPAGSALAALLARRGWDVLLVDRACFPRDKTCGDGLTPRSVPALARLGVLDELAAAGYQRIDGVRMTSPAGETWRLSFADHPVGLPAHGYVIPRYELDDRLLRHAVACGARFQPDTNAVGPLARKGAAGEVARGVGGVRAEVGGRSVNLHARVTVLAVGASIGLLRSFGVLHRMPAGINAIRGYFTGVPDLHSDFEFYFEKELAPGYAWVFPLADGRANIGLGVLARQDGQPAPNLPRLMADFLARWPRLREARPAGPLKGYPLRVDFPSHAVFGNGFILAGEAAGLVNPVTGEGIDLALESAELAATAVDQALRRDNVTARGLAPYQRRLDQRFGPSFRQIRILLRLATGPRALTILIHQATRKPHLAHVIAGINLGSISPLAAFSPRTWWDILT